MASFLQNLFCPDYGRLESEKEAAVRDRDYFRREFEAYRDKYEAELKTSRDYSDQIIASHFIREQMPVPERETAEKKAAAAGAVDDDIPLSEDELKILRERAELYAQQMLGDDRTPTPEEIEETFEKFKAEPEKWLTDD